MATVGVKAVRVLLENFGIKELEYMKPFYKDLAAVVKSATHP